MRFTWWRSASFVLLGAVAMLAATGCKPLGNTYAGCVSSADCTLAADGCFDVRNGSATGSICTRTCLGDLDCPGAGICFGGSCLETCSGDFDCPGRFSCTNRDAAGNPLGASLCLPGAAAGTPAYESCFSSGECDVSAPSCVRITVDGASQSICTLSGCRPGFSDCPLDSRGGIGECLSFDAGRTNTCFERCRDAGDCLTGFVCKSRLADGTSFTPICLPAS